MTNENQKSRVARAIAKFLGRAVHPVEREWGDADPEKAWMGTSTGRKFYPLAPRAQDVDIRDIARGLAMTCRYAGQVKRYYSVAEHCVFVSMYVPWQYAKEAIVHDSAEAYIGDMIRPLKHQPEMLEFRKAEERIEIAIYNALGIVSTPESRAAIKDIDNRILVDEISTLSACPGFYLDTPFLRDRKPLGVQLRCMNPADAEAWFLTRFRSLFGDIA